MSETAVIKIKDSILKDPKETFELEAPILVSEAIDQQYHDYTIVHSRLGKLKKENIGNTYLLKDESIVVFPEYQGLDLLVTALILAAKFLLKNAVLILTVAASAYSYYSTTRNVGRLSRASGATSREGDGFGEEDPNYGWNGPQSTADPDLPIPIIYGKNLIGGNFINEYVTDTDDKSFLNVQLGLCEGKVKSVGGVTSSTDNIKPSVPLYLDEISGKSGKFEFPQIMFPNVQALGMTKASGYISFDINISDVSEMDDFSVEVGSGRTHDIDSLIYTTTVSSLGLTDNTWKTIKLQLSLFTDKGTIDYNRLNYFRFFSFENSDSDGVENNQTIKFRNVKIKYASFDLDDVAGLIKIDGNPINTFRNVELFVRLGEDEQTAMPGFGQIHRWQNLRGANVKLTQNNPYIFLTTNNDVNQMILHFEVPQLYRLPGDSGEFRPWHIWFKIEYRKYTLDGSESWIVHSDQLIQEMTQQFIRRQYSIDGIDQDQYEIRVTRTSEDPNNEPVSERGTVGDLFFVAVDEIFDEEFTYPGTALLGLKVLATDQLSGSLPNVRTVVEGLEITDWDGETYYSNNPILCLYDFLHNPITRRSIADHINPQNDDLGLYLESKEYCDELITNPRTGLTQKRFTLNIAFGGETRAVDAILRLMSVCRGLPVYAQGAILSLIDKFETSVNLFTTANMIEDSFALEYSRESKRINVYEVQYLNEENDYLRETIQIEDPDRVTNKDSWRPRTLFLPGITNTYQALLIGWFNILSEKYNDEVVKFRVAIDAINQNAGDVIDIATDVTQYGDVSGRVKGSGTSTNTITVRKKVTISLAKTYQIYVRHQVANDDGTENIEVKTIVFITGDDGIYSPGDDITVNSPWSTAPADYDIFAIGEQNIAVKPFRIVEISRDNNYEIEVTAIEHNSNAYDETFTDIPPVNFSNIPEPGTRPPRVENLTATNTNAYNFEVILSWTIPRQFYFDEESQEFIRINSQTIDHFEIWYADSYDEDLHWEKVNETTETSARFTGLSPYAKYFIRVVTVNAIGIKTEFESSPTINFTPELDLPPENVRHLEILNVDENENFVGKNCEFGWSRPSQSSIAPRAGDEPQGAGSQPPDPFVKEWLIRIESQKIQGIDPIHSDPDQWFKRREEIVTSPAYVYTFDKNGRDHTKRIDPILLTPTKKFNPQRKFRILVWAIGFDGTISELPSILEANNSVPDGIIPNENPYPIDATGNPSKYGLDDAIQITTIVASETYRLSWKNSASSDVKGYTVHRLHVDSFSIPAGADLFTVTDANRIYIGSDTNFISEFPDDSWGHYYRIAGYDSFEIDENKVDLTKILFQDFYIRVWRNGSTLTKEIVFPYWELT